MVSFDPSLIDFPVERIRDNRLLGLLREIGEAINEEHDPIILRKGLLVMHERDEAARVQAATEDMIRMRFQQFEQKPSRTVETIKCRCCGLDTYRAATGCRICDCDTFDK